MPVTQEIEMFNAHYEEHLAHSAPCASRWDGFDRGDTGIPTTTRQCIGRLTSSTGKRVAVWQEITDDGWGDSFCEYRVKVDGELVFSHDCRDAAIAVARRWLTGRTH